MALLFTAACGGSDNVGDEHDEAVDALRRQIERLSDGQYRRAYNEIHPAQQELFTADEYEDCLTDRGAGAVEFEGLTVKETYTESVTVDGTGQEAESVAITAEVRFGELGTQTDTYHEIQVEDEWRFIVTNANEIANGEC